MGGGSGHSLAVIKLRTQQGGKGSGKRSENSRQDTGPSLGGFNTCLDNNTLELEDA